MCKIDTSDNVTDDNTDNDTDDDTGNNGIQPTLKRKHSPSRKLSTLGRSKRHPTNTTHSTEGKRRKPTSQLRPWHSRCGADEDDEYEVQKILEARVYRRKLQYRVEWLGFEDDPAWYDASNFKNSPRKLREFHTASSTFSDPPRRLAEWERCWENDIDADIHPDDNKPYRLRAGRKTP
jgi:hypothetical protein